MENIIQEPMNVLKFFSFFWILNRAPLEFETQDKDLKMDIIRGL